MATVKQIKRQAVELDTPDLRNDYDGDNKVDMADARIAERQQAGLEPRTANGLSYQYLNMANEYLDKYKNAQFNYDFNADPIYRQAREAYMRQGQLAAKDVQARAAALTGGYGNSYGAMAAQQQYNQALNNVNNIIPQLEANAYNRWQDEQARNMSLTQLYLDRENTEYNRAYNEEERDYNRAFNEDERDYNRQYNQALLGAEYKDYSGLNELGIDTGHYQSLEKLDEDWAQIQRARQAKEWDQADQTFAWNIALNAAQFKDYSKLKEMGIDVSSQEQQDLIDRAITWAQYGDYSLLRELGVDTGYLQALQNLELAQTDYNMAMLYGAGDSYDNGSGGGYSGGSSGRYSSRRRSSGGGSENATETQSNNENRDNAGNEKQNTAGYAPSSKAEAVQFAKENGYNINGAVGIVNGNYVYGVSDSTGDYWYEPTRQNDSDKKKGGGGFRKTAK